MATTIPLTKRVFSSLKITFGIPTVVISLFVGFGSWLLKPEWNISLAVFIPLATFLVILIITLAVLVVDLHHSLDMRFTPKLMTIISYSDNRSVMLFNPNEWFIYDTMVSIYILNEQGFEELIAIGIVINIQENKMIQVEPKYLNGMDKHVNRLNANDIHILGKVILKPQIHRSFYMQSE